MITNYAPLIQKKYESFPTAVRLLLQLPHVKCHFSPEHFDPLLTKRMKLTIMVADRLEVEIASSNSFYVYYPRWKRLRKKLSVLELLHRVTLRVL